MSRNPTTIFNFQTKNFTLVYAMSEINVLYCFDSRFSKLATVSIYSLLKNKHDTTHINLYCMVAPHTHGKRKIQKVIDKFPHAKMIWRTIRHHENPFRKHDFSRWSPVIFYRLFTCDIFPELNKILYLDSDTIICSDLTELYNTNISDYAMGAVRDMAPIYDKNHPNGRYVYDFAHKYLNDDPYYNSGVLLINVKNMRKNKEILNINIPLKYPDQDLLKPFTESVIYGRSGYDREDLIWSLRRLYPPLPGLLSGNNAVLPKGTKEVFQSTSDL